MFYIFDFFGVLIFLARLILVFLFLTCSNFPALICHKIQGKFGEKLRKANADVLLFFPRHSGISRSACPTTWRRIFRTCSTWATPTRTASSATRLVEGGRGSSRRDISRRLVERDVPLLSATKGIFGRSVGFDGVAFEMSEKIRPGVLPLSGSAFGANHFQ